MTSIVKVSAHCSPNKEVVIDRETSGGIGYSQSEYIVLQDGESREFTIYDNVQLRYIKEVEKLPENAGIAT